MSESEIKPKKVLSEEQLRKLALAREKAMQVRQAKAAKLQELKHLEKENKEKQLNDKINELKSKVEVSQPSPEVMMHNPSDRPGREALLSKDFPIDIPKPREKPKKREKKEKVKRRLESLLEDPSSDDSSDDGNDSDDSDIVKDFLKKKYRNKYKNKYESKVNHMLLKGHSANYIKNRVSEDMIRIAQNDLFN